jgi:hypothetical protein
MEGRAHAKTAFGVRGRNLGLSCHQVAKGKQRQHNRN